MTIYNGAAPIDYLPYNNSLFSLLCRISPRIIYIDFNNSRIKL